MSIKPLDAANTGANDEVVVRERRGLTAEPELAVGTRLLKAGHELATEQPAQHAHG